MTINKFIVHFFYLLLNTNVLIISHFNLSLLLKIRKQEAYKVWEWMGNRGVMGIFSHGVVEDRLM